MYSTNDILINTNKLISNNLLAQANNNIFINSTNIDLKNSKLQSVAFIGEKYVNGYKQGDINLTTSNLNLNNTTLASNDINVGTQRIWPPRALTLGHLTHNDLATVRISK